VNVFQGVSGGSFPIMQCARFPEMGWVARQNGELLKLASNLFDLFITVDQRLSYQQDVERFSIAIVVLVARRNKLEFLLPLMPELRRVLEDVQPGKVYQVNV
jgi:hypothetical protein